MSHQCRFGGLIAGGHSGQHVGARFLAAHAVERNKLGHLPEPRAIGGFIIAQAHPRLQPAIAREGIFQIIQRRDIVGSVEINRQETADRRAG